MALFVDHQHIDVSAAPKAVVGNGEKSIGVRWQPHAHHIRCQRDHRVDQSGPLMTEPVVVVAPARAGEQHVQRGDGCSPGQSGRMLQPLGVLDQHRHAHHRESLVAREQSVSARQQVRLEPALTQMLTEHLHDAAVGGQIVVELGGRQLPASVGGLEHGLQTVAGGLVGAEQAESATAVGSCVVEVDIPHHLPEYGGRLVRDASRGVDRQSVVLEITNDQGLQQHTAVGVGSGPEPLVARRSEFTDVRRGYAVVVEE